MALNIPQYYKAGIVNIVNLSEEETNELIEVLNNSPYLSDFGKISEQISPIITSIPLTKLKEILETLYSIYHVREFSGVGMQRFLDDLTESIVKIFFSDSSSKEIERIPLKEKLYKLLNINMIKIISKAYRLQSDGERLYCNSKILSDIRPIFNEDPNTRPDGAVITHTLKIVHHAGRELEEFHIVLDSQELEELKEVINRACAKDKTLRSLMKEANLTNLGA